MSAPPSTAPPATDRPSVGARAQRVLHEPRLLLMLLAGGVMAGIAIWVVAFSGAFYTTTTSSPNNTFTAAQVKLTLSSAGQIVDGTNLTPGTTRSGTIAVTNSEYRASLSLSASGITDTPAGTTLADVVDVSVTETSPGNVLRYNGKLAGLTAVDLGTWASGERRDYTFELDWPAISDSLSRAGVQTSFSFDWKAVAIP